jgi:hypothetical protein
MTEEVDGFVVRLSVGCRKHGVEVRVEPLAAFKDDGFGFKPQT